MISLKKKIKGNAQRFLFRNDKFLYELSTKNIDQNFAWIWEFIITRKPSINFIITSSAEIRVFTPIIDYLINNSEFKINIILLRDFKFRSKDLIKFTESKNVRFTFSTLPLLYSLNNNKYLNIICLDFLNEKWHKLGVDVINYLKNKKAKTVCVQHGGSQKDNIIGHSNSVSRYQIVYGKFVYDELLKLNVNKDRIYLTGNPLHDGINNICRKEVEDRLTREGFIIDNKIILIATCLFGEYDNRVNPKYLYEKYIREIYNNIDFKKYKVIIKMHPNDKENPNLYLIEIINNQLTSNNLKIITPTNNDYSFYELAKISDLIISRSSTVVEEGMLLGKKVISFDLFKDGPSMHLSHLEKYSNFKRVVLNENNLKTVIEELINKQTGVDDKTDLINKITYKLDGNSRERIKKALEDIIYNKSYALE